MAKMEFSKIKYPNMRDELLHYLSNLSNITYQKNAWVEGEFPPGVEFDNLDSAIHFLFDDTSLGDDPSSMVGVILIDEREVKFIADLIEALNSVFEKYGLNLSDESYINLPEWKEVIKRAQEALDVLKVSS
ncbi:SCO4402 family protein [Comamonas piscis]